MNSDIPLLETPCSLIPMVCQTILPTVSIVYEIQPNDSKAFCVKNRVLHLNSTSVISTTCSGLVCDKGNTTEWDNYKGCGYIGMNHSISNIALVHSIWIGETNDSDNANGQVTHGDFSST